MTSGCGWPNSPRSVSTSTSFSRPKELGMYGDFSRLTFDPGNHYTAVWSQQGRIQLDADFNEQTAILLDWMRTLARDFIGPAGGHILWARFAGRRGRPQPVGRFRGERGPRQRRSGRRPRPLLRGRDPMRSPAARLERRSRRLPEAATR